MRFHLYWVVMIIVGILQKIEAASSVTPSWIANSFFEAYPISIKTDLTTKFNSTSPALTVTATFVKGYSVAPQLAFGVKNFRGNFSHRFR